MMMTKEELLQKIHQIKDLQRMSEELNAELESLTDDIKAVMTEQQTDVLVVDCFKVSWKSVTTNRFDTKSFKEKYSDLYSQYTKPTESKRFSIN